jgi:hypothetical protein
MLAALHSNLQPARPTEEMLPVCAQAQFIGESTDTGTQLGA